jgi:hypothetical protein
MLEKAPLSISGLFFRKKKGFDVLFTLYEQTRTNIFD